MSQRQVFIPVRQAEFKKIMKAQFGKKLVSNSKKQFLLTKSQYTFWQEHRPISNIKCDYEVKSKPMTDADFEKFHRSYLASAFKVRKKSFFSGKYVLICHTETKNRKSRQPLMICVSGIRPIRKVLDKHQEHDYVLVHQSRARRFGIKRNDPIWWRVNK